MNAPLPALDWLMSAYDATWHAFPTAQLTDPTRTFYQALCEHSVPARHAERTAPRVFCPACLVLYGTHIPDDQRWQMGGCPDAHADPAQNRHQLEARHDNRSTDPPRRATGRRTRAGSADSPSPAGPIHP